MGAQTDIKGLATCGHQSLPMPAPGKEATARRVLLDMNRRRAPESPSRAVVDAIMDRYVNWRERSAAVEMAFDSWRKASRPERELAFAAYLTSLDREERAAAEFRRAVEEARFATSPAPPSAA